jgi:uncharacterized protein YbjT (DUF2867 family)
VRALVHSAAWAKQLSALTQVQIVEGDMALPATLSTALRDVDRAMLISSADPTMLEVQCNFIDAAATASVKHIVTLSGIMLSPDRATSTPTAPDTSGGGAERSAP